MDCELKIFTKVFNFVVNIRRNFRIFLSGIKNTRNHETLDHVSVWNADFFLSRIVSRKALPLAMIQRRSRNKERAWNKELREIWKKKKKLKNRRVPGKGEKVNNGSHNIETNSPSCGKNKYIMWSTAFSVEYTGCPKSDFEKVARWVDIAIIQQKVLRQISLRRAVRELSIKEA